VLRHESGSLAAGQELAAELALLAGAPGPDVAVDVEGECVVRAAGDLGDVLQAVEQKRPALFLDELSGAAVAESGPAFAVLSLTLATGL